ncbi:tellurite resistance TerB family protein [Pendulispora albinea]|uniref:Tellurite resistance TerB family protein n=1 Tax=Pendulispora albinea TaxID=2741071 RepID=A0ABZ2MAZ9_9BACT
MGLFSKILGTQPQKKASDDVLLLHGMLLMAGADGVLEGSERATLEAFLTTLPEFRDADFEEQLQQANKVAQKFSTLKESVRALGDISSESVRKKCFILAADIALASGDIDEREEELLETMQRILGIDDALAQQAIQVLALKYAV